MDRFTFRIPAEHKDGLQEMADDGLFYNRSEAARTAIRELLTKEGFLERDESERIEELRERIDELEARLALQQTPTSESRVRTKSIKNGDRHDHLPSNPPRSLAEVRDD